ncbi:quinon protein alcohol dehydrogenase-like superfamily [Hygrophoropsis aurantiaca]|uniref:Quinon protein alcohol dehydrogenase-like superfamily n=1 Tax=Hygrophoropsis aurantiaca TaxID=72124 RepID=A0ACB7ZWF5_9AGAM|nr:quinon protein alcohol dehydrogenase-like superfamily [Hygrophoropsis aurantiaca]
MSTSTSLELEDPAPRLPTKVFEGHTSVLELVAYFRDGKRITFSGSKDNTVRIWNVESQKQNGESLVHDFPVHSMALSPDERRLVSGGRGVVLWDLEGRTVVWKKEVDETDGQHVAYSPDGRLISASHNEEIVLLDAETGEQIRQPLQLGGFVRCLAFSPDWTRIAAGSYNGNVQVFEVATGETVVGTFTAHTAGVMSLVYTPDGQQFVTASMDHSVRVWDAATGQEIGDLMLGHRGWVRQISCSRDGQRLASASTDSTVRVWDLKTRRQIVVPLRIQGNYDFYSVSWSPDGRSIIAGLLSGRICLWDVPPHDDHPVIPQAPAPTTNSPPVLNTSRPRINSISSSILNLPAGSSPTPSQSPEANTGPGEDDDQREYPTNESFDSVLDLPADGTQPAQKRKRRRRRRTLNSSLPIPAVPNTLAITAPESHAPQSQTTPPSKAIAADAPVDAQTSGSRFGQLTRSWIRRLTKSTLRRTRKPSFANVDDPLQARDNSKTTHAAQKSQGNAAEENTSEPRQVNNSRPRQRRQRHTRRNEETGMIAPAPMYDVSPLIPRIVLEYATRVIYDL